MFFCFCFSKWSASASLGKQKSCWRLLTIFSERFIQELERQTVLVINERRGRGHCDGGRVQVNYRAISAAFNFAHKSPNTVCVPALCVHVHSLCHITRLAVDSSRTGSGKHTIKNAIQCHIGVRTTYFYPL